MKLSYARLGERLEKGELAPVYVVTGDQELLRELAVRRIQQAAVGEEPSPFNLERFDGEQTESSAVLSSANMLPMLGGRRAVIVKRANALLEGSEAFLAFLDDPSPHAVVVLELSKKPDRRKKSWKEIETKAAVVSCDAPRWSELEDWVLEQARGRGLRLGREAARYLVGEFGGNLRRLVNELEKLSLYAGGERLELETIATVLGRGKAQSIFKFVDAVGAGETGTALRQLGRLLEEGEPPLRILALLDRLIGQLRVAKEIQASGARGGLASALGLPPYAAKSLARNARRFGPRDLDRALGSLANTDRILKSSGLPARLVLESLVISLCAVGR